jgi:hypothetical protein
LVAEHEDGQEGDGDDEQGEEQARADLARRFADDHGLTARRRAACDALLLQLEVLVRVLDHDDGGIDHHADGKGQAAQAHDVGVDVEQLHHQDRHQQTHGEGEDRHQRAAHVRGTPDR